MDRVVDWACTGEKYMAWFAGVCIGLGGSGCQSGPARANSLGFFTDFYLRNDFEGVSGEKG
jgi:hypothetical protein